MVNKDNQDIEIRLYGIDAPEFNQPGAKASRNSLAALVEKKGQLKLDIMDRDHYGRLVAMVHTGNINVNEELVRSGHAWVYRRYCRIPLCDRWIALAERARVDGTGLWRQKNPVSPWQWKARKKRRQ